MAESRPEPSETALEPASKYVDTMVEETNTLPFPFISVVLLAVIILIFIAMFVVGQGDVTRVAVLFGGKDNDLIRAGEWWRLITAIFLHGGWFHLIVNGLTILMLGVPIERIYGSRKFLMIYMLAGIMGNLFSFWFSSLPSLGASGALYGLMGAGLIFPVRFRDRVDPVARKHILRQLGRALLINLAINFMPGLNLDKWAHLGGIVGGGLAALVWIPDVLEESPPTRAYNIALWVGTCGMLLLISLAGIQQWQSARRMPMRVEIQTNYVTDRADAWWGMLLPLTWRRVDTIEGQGTKWVGPGQVALQILDNKGSPGEVEAVSRFLERYKNDPKLVNLSVTIDGKPGQQYIFVDRDSAIHLYVVLIDGHTLCLFFSVPHADYANVNPTFEAIVNSIRFVRPPSN